LKNSLLWIIICIICIMILLVVGRAIIEHFTSTSNSIYGGELRNLRNREYALWEEEQIRKNPDYDNLAIYIDIISNTLELIDLNTNSTIKTYQIASGKKETPSPLGNFIIINKAKWGKGFGTRWMGLNVPWADYQQV